MIEIIPIDTPSLGDRSYIATDGARAVVVDPQRDIDRFLAITGERGLTITHVVETHIHNDYVTGGHALAEKVGATYVVAAGDDVSFDRLGVRDGDVLTSGRMRLRVIATPGHTFTHVAYALEADGEVHGVFSGGSLLYGSTGRTDLLGEEHAETLARHQHGSAQRLVEELPATTPLFPTHGFGSFCSATQAEGDSSTLATEADSNPALTEDEETYVQDLLAGLDAYPAYYAHMAPRNSDGPSAADLRPPAVADPDEIRRRIDAGEWVVDLRSREAFAAGHVPGTVSLGLDGSFVTYLGWMIPWGAPVTLLGDTPEQVAQAQRDMARIGIDRPAAAATGLPTDWAGEVALATLRAATFDDLAETRRGTPRSPVVLDVRLDGERSEAAVVGSLHIPLHDLVARLDEVPADREVWVHCAAGYRAALATSLLARHGREVVLVDDEFDRAHAAGLDLESPAAMAA